MKKNSILNFMTILLMFLIPIEPLVGVLYSYYRIAYIFIILFFILFSKKKKIRIDYYQLFFFMFCLFSFFSIVYTAHQQSSISMAIELAINTILAFGVSYIFSLVESENEFEKKFVSITKGFIIGTFVITLYLLIVELPKMGMWGRLGEELYLNYGSYMVYSYCIIISLCIIIWYLMQYKNTEKKEKFLYILIMIILLAGAFASGTRKSIICPVIFSLLLFILKSKGNMVKTVSYLLTLGFVVAVGYYIMMNNTMLYNRIGIRVENMINQLTIGTSEGSINERNYLMNKSLELFKIHPIKGYGLHAFRYYSLIQGGPFLYSHCNYTELLADLGIIGFGLYYISYFYIIIKSLKKKNNNFSIFIIPFLLMNLISDFGTVSYYRHYYVIFFFIMAKYCMIENNKLNKADNK